MTRPPIIICQFIQYLVFELISLSLAPTKGCSNKRIANYSLGFLIENKLSTLTLTIAHHSFVQILCHHLFIINITDAEIFNGFEGLEIFSSRIKLESMSHL